MRYRDMHVYCMPACQHMHNACIIIIGLGADVSRFSLGMAFRPQVSSLPGIVTADMASINSHGGLSTHTHTHPGISDYHFPLSIYTAGITDL